jgi:GTP 3',8-cyclase
VETTLRDRLGRPVEDLRVSVTDRCNLRCRYCMPREVFGPDHAFLPRSELLTFEEITRVVRTAVSVGVTKIRLTGGEPLLRKDLPDLVAQLAAIEGIADLALTTNGLLLPQHAAALADAGLHRVTVSLDAVDETTFRAVADTRASVTSVLEGIAAARAAGLGPIKVNAVLQRGVNDDQLEDLAGWARDADVTLRFIEFMDVGTTNGWVRTASSRPGRSSSGCTPAGRSSRSTATTPARWPSATATSTVPARSASSRR